MKMKQYQNPEMKVIKLINRQALLVGSGEEAPGCITECGTDED